MLNQEMKARNEMKFVPAPLKALPLQPQNVKELDEIMTTMDKNNGTSFKHWIQSMENISYICTFKRDFFENYFQSSPQTVIVVIQWLSLNWTVPSIAEFVLKMFYHWKLESPQFGALLNGLVEDWTRKRTFDLLHVLLIGESPKSIATFIRNFTTSYKFRVDSHTRNWSRYEIVDLFTHLSIRMQWDNEMITSILLIYSTLVLDQVTVLPFIHRIKSEFFGTASSITMVNIVECLLIEQEAAILGKILVDLKNIGSSWVDNKGIPRSDSKGVFEDENEE